MLPTTKVHPPILIADACLMIEQQQAFMEKFLQQQNVLTTGLLKQKRALYRSVIRLMALIETNNSNRESQNTEQPTEQLKEPLFHGNQNLLDIPKE